MLANPPQLQYYALLDRFQSNVDALDFSSGSKTLKIRKLSIETLKECVSCCMPHLNNIVETAVLVGEDKFWIEYSYNLGNSSPEEEKKANNSVFQDIDKFLLSLRLFKQGYVRNIFYFLKLPHYTSICPIKYIRTDERLFSLQENEVNNFKQFRTGLEGIEKSASLPALGISIGRFVDGYERVKLQDRVIDYMIGLEALYLQGERNELTYKLAHRMSVLLENDKVRRKQLFRRVIDSYQLRSSIVHGGKNSLKQEDVWFLEDTLRLSINAFFAVPNPNWVDLIF